MIKIKTQRLILRETMYEDFSELCKILQDREVMYAWGHAFSDMEVQDWIEKNLKRYKDYGFGIWSVILKGTGELIGQAGVVVLDLKGIYKDLISMSEIIISGLNYENSKNTYEITYMLKKSHWHKGYATEAAAACRDYVFDEFGNSEVFTTIRDINLSSIRVAKRIRMAQCGTLIKKYKGKDMAHLLFSTCYHGNKNI